jgi:thiol-disulfide isomerase/thioredoxin
MDRTRRSSTALLVLSALVVGLWSQDAGGAGRRGRRRLIGRPAPQIRGDFALNGKPVALTHLRGKVVLVDFWGLDCPHCIAALPHLRKLHTRYHKKGLAVVGLMRLDGAKKSARNKDLGRLKSIASRNKLKHLLMTLPEDKIHKIWKKYKVSVIPHVVLIDRKGKVRLVKVGGGKGAVRGVEKKIKKLLAEEA